MGEDPLRGDGRESIRVVLVLPQGQSQHPGSGEAIYRRSHRLDGMLWDKDRRWRSVSWTRLADRRIIVGRASGSSTPTRACSLPCRGCTLNEAFVEIGRPPRRPQREPMSLARPWWRWPQAGRPGRSGSRGRRRPRPRGRTWVARARPAAAWCLAATTCSQGFERGDVGSGSSSATAR